MSIMNLYENNVISIITNYINNYKKKYIKNKVMLTMNSSENSIISITTYHINNYEKKIIKIN